MSPLLWALLYHEGGNFASRTLWTGDNLDILRGMDSTTIDLIYLDPPFNSNKDYAAPVGSKAAGAAFKDTWHLSDLDVAWAGLVADEEPAIAYLLDASGRTHSKGMQSYLTMMAVRLLEMRRVLKPTGSIYLHCDPTANAYLRALMDAIFGRSNFRNEIVWAYRKWGVAAGQFARNHDTLLLYSKSDASTFNVQYVEPSEGTRKRWGGRRQNAVFSADGTRQASFTDAQAKSPMPDWWQISILNPNAKERVGYPTQKPLALLERIIVASSNPGDMVLDPFCGCATACVAADKLDRQWVGIDLSPKAADLVRERLSALYDRPLQPYEITHRTDVPRRQDVESTKDYRQHKHVLYGEQEGHCAGCKTHFEFRNFHVDHIIPQAKGGTGHIDNLQLLCGHCNSTKGDRPMEYLVARLAENGLVAAGH